MLEQICANDQCTSCNACIEICPKQCIITQEDELGCTYPVTDLSKCINCGLCRKVCHTHNRVTLNSPLKVYAAWSLNENIRRTSASGGIATELYSHFIPKGGWCTGVTYERETGCHFIPVESQDDINRVRNSKYTFSETFGIFKQTKEKLEERRSVLFIGLPCQVAALKTYLRKDYENLTTVDIVCHGVPPSTYLSQHIAEIERKKKKKTETLYFRDPQVGSHRFCFTLYAEGKRIYKKAVISQDVFQVGYHKALIYRENCYKCCYAKRERVGDLTISDFSGLGRIKPFNGNIHSVSCVLANTEKGESLLQELKSSIHLETRPKDEAFCFEKQLNGPSRPHPSRDTFITEYKQSHNFEDSAKRALHKELIKNRLENITQRRRIKPFLKKLIPTKIKKIIKNTILNKD